MTDKLVPNEAVKGHRRSGQTEAENGLAERVTHLTSAYKASQANIHSQLVDVTRSLAKATERAVVIDTQTRGAGSLPDTLRAEMDRMSPKDSSIVWSLLYFILMQGALYVAYSYWRNLNKDVGRKFI